MSCILPYKQMIIRPDGKTSLCCNDPYGKNTLADVNKMTLREAASKYLDVTKDTVRNWIKKTDIPAHKIGKLWKFKRIELDAWVKSGHSAID